MTDMLVNLISPFLNEHIYQNITLYPTNIQNYYLSIKSKKYENPQRVALSVIQRAITGIIIRTPSRLLKEIILVDDFGSNGEQHDKE